MSDKEWTATSVFELFGDELSRQILVLASVQPVSVAALAERLDASKPTIYRRVNTLVDHDLVREEIHPDRVDGNHHKRFETTLKRATIEIEDGGLDVNVELRRDLVDQFEAFWKEFGGSAPQMDPGVPDPQPDPEGHNG